jgi:choice-of-anchor C domain-containing protein
MRNLIAVAAVAATLGSASAANAVTIINGSFETLTVSVPAGTAPNFNSSYREVLAPNATAISGWNVGVIGPVGAAGVDIIRNFWQASNGSYSLDLNARGAGSVSQLLTGLNPFYSYTLTFDMSKNPQGAPPRSLLLSVGNLTPSTFTYTLANSRSAMGWQSMSYTFIANSTSALLTFASLANGPYGAALDNVAIRQTFATQVPEPESWMLMVAGFGMVGFAARRRKTVVAA